MYSYLLVFIGAGIGGTLRHGINSASMPWIGSAFSYHTLTINILGSFLMGLLVSYFAFKGTIPAHWQFFLTTGILGGFTTFSAFSLDTVLLWQRNDLSLSLIYVALSVLLSIGGLLMGLWITKLGT